MRKYIFLSYLIVLLKFLISIEAKTKIYKIFNRSIDESVTIYIVPGSKELYRPKFMEKEKVKKNKINDKIGWEITADKEYTYIKMSNPPSEYNKNVCIHVKDFQRGTLIMGPCDENARMIFKNKKISPEKNKDLCIGKYNGDTVDALNLNRCDDKNDQKYQIWELDNFEPERCGEDYGRCKDGQCCSTMGYCGVSSEHCYNDCQSKYGRCGDLINDKNRCGWGYGSCPDGLCCSKYGYCNNKESHCKFEDGCQFMYGKCGYDIDKCGEHDDGKNYGICPDGKCCSQYGYCGNSEKHCRNGCQTKYGICENY